MELIAQGAEAKLYRNDNSIIKERIRKSYRIEEIDDKLRRSRTRREAKILEKLAAIDFPAPRLIENDKKERLVMEFIDGDKVRDILEKKDYISLSKEIGKKIAILHNHGILHGDLTTSNMILDKEVFFIDFGLGFFSKRLEDKAVDLHLFRQSYQVTNFMVVQSLMPAVSIMIVDSDNISSLINSNQ